jgi:hypothetical protein
MFDAKVLLDALEEQFYSPPKSVELCDEQGG